MRIGLGVGNELRNGRDRNGWMDFKDKRSADDVCDRRDVADEVVIEFVVESRIECIGRGDHKERISVARRTRDRFGGNMGTGPRPVLDDERLTEPLRQPLADQTCGNVGRAASRKSDDDAHQTRWIALRSSDA